jgi:hypothetical protein
MKPSTINTGILSILSVISSLVTTITPVLTTTPPPAAAPAAAPAPKVVQPPLVLVSTLTPKVLKNFTKLYGQLLAVKFTTAQQQNIQERLSKEWMTNLVLRQNVAQTEAMAATIVKGTPAERSQLQSKTVGKLRQQVLDGDADALWLVSFYDAAPKNWLVADNPPLTRMTTDSGSDALCFMINEIMGQTVVTNSNQLKNTVAAKFKDEYPELSPAIKQELSKLSPTWLKFKTSQWYALGDEFREEMRVYWGQKLEVYIPELRDMTKLRRDRLERLKNDPTNPWDAMNTLQRQVALLKPDLDFQNGQKMFARQTPIQLNNYISVMDLGTAIGVSPTRYPIKSAVKSNRK